MPDQFPTDHDPGDEAQSCQCLTHKPEKDWSPESAYRARESSRRVERAASTSRPRTHKEPDRPEGQSCSNLGCIPCAEGRAIVCRRSSIIGDVVLLPVPKDQVARADRGGCAHRIVVRQLDGWGRCLGCSALVSEPAQ